MNRSTRAIGRKQLELCAVATLVDSGVRHFHGTKRYVKTGDVVDNGIAFTEEVTYEDRPTRVNMEDEENDVLCARMQATEQVLLVTREEKDCLFSNGFAVLRLRVDLILPK